MGRATAEEWAKRVERWRDSGLTAKEFAAEAGLNAGTLSGWAWKLRKEGTSTATSTAGDGIRGSCGGVRADEAPSFVELPSTELVKNGRSSSTHLLDKKLAPAYGSHPGGAAVSLLVPYEPV